MREEESADSAAIHTSNFLIDLYAFVILDLRESESGDFSNIGKSHSHATVRVLGLSDEPYEIKAIIRHDPDERLDMDVIYHFSNCRYIAQNNIAEFAFLLADVRESEKYEKGQPGGLGSRMMIREDESIPEIKLEEETGILAHERDRPSATDITITSEPRSPTFTIIGRVREVRSQNFSLMWATMNEDETDHYLQVATIRLGWELPLGAVQPGVVYRIEGNLYSLSRYSGWLATTVTPLKDNELPPHL